LGPLIKFHEVNKHNKGVEKVKRHKVQVLPQIMQVLGQAGGIVGSSNMSTKSTEQGPRNSPDLLRLGASCKLVNTIPEREPYCGYIRVSTKGQDYNSQLAIIERYAAYRKLTIGKVYSEKVSGAKARRPQYAAMLDALRNYQYQGVIVLRLDRLGRNSRELSMNVAELENKGLKVLSATENYDTNTAIGRAMREIIFIMAALEREQIGEATKARVESARQAGKHLGRKPASRKQIRRVMELHSQGMSLQAITRNSQISYGTVWAIINKRGCYADTQPVLPKKGNQLLANVDVNKRPANSEAITQE
jgi:DNA invertase Pin-like site-specific DNA recombinase